MQAWSWTENSSELGDVSAKPSDARSSSQNCITGSEIQASFSLVARMYSHDYSSTAVKFGIPDENHAFVVGMGIGV
jgi:hypothetical protein